MLRKLTLVAALFLAGACSSTTRVTHAADDGDVVHVTEATTVTPAPDALVVESSSGTTTHFETTIIPVESATNAPMMSSAQETTTTTTETDTRTRLRKD